MAQVAPAVAPVTLPPSETVSVEVAAARLGLSRGKAYGLPAERPPGAGLRFGRKMAVPVRALDRLLWADDLPETADIAHPLTA